MPNQAPTNSKVTAGREEKGSVSCPSHVFFAGGGWSCSYYIGAYRAMVERWPESDINGIVWAGNSAGSVIAAACAIGLAPDRIEYIYEQLLHFASKYGIFGKTSIYHDYMMDLVLNDNENAYKKCNGRLFIGITTFPLTYKQISHWDSNDELRITLHQTMHLPYWMTNTDCQKDGIIAIDGGFSKTFHRFNDTTLVLSAYGGNASNNSSNNNDNNNNNMNDDSDEMADISFLDAKNLNHSFKFYKTDKDTYCMLKQKGFEMMHQWDGTYKATGTFNSDNNNHIIKQNRKNKKDLMSVSRFFAKNLDFNEKNSLKRNIVMFPLAMIAWGLRYMEQTIVIKKVIFYFILFKIFYQIYISCKRNGHGFPKITYIFNMLKAKRLG